MGALLYDMGKIPLMGYYDGSKERDESAEKMHVLTGYNMIKRTQKYPFAVASMAAFHHEYYGGKGSYNFTNPIIKKITGINRKEAEARYFITYSDREFIMGEAMAFFPCKLMEVVDIFVGLTGKETVSYLSTVNTIKKEYIAQSLMVDPLVFEIFVAFLEKCGLLTPEEKNEMDSIIY
jgi:hypothetical protein